MWRSAAALATSAAVVVSLGQAAPAQTVPPPDQGPVTLTADHIEYDTDTGNVVADGHVVATRGSTKITADHLTGNLKTGDVRATGHVVLTQPGRTATGENLTYNYRTRVGEMSQATAKYAPWTVTGRTITAAAGQSVAVGASATPCDPVHPAFRVTAKRVVVVPDDHLTAYDAVLYAYGVPVLYVPAYSVSLKKGQSAAGGPLLGYDTYDGIWIQYPFYIPLGDWESLVTAFYGTRSGLSGAADINRQFPDYYVDFHLGRAVAFDQGGTQWNLDQYTAEVDLPGRRIGSLPASYQISAQAGNIYEDQTGVNAFRTDGLLTFTTDTIYLNPAKSLTASAGGYYRYDTYSTGNTRDIVAASAAMTQVLTPLSSTTLSYNYAAVNGATPFSFDIISPSSAVSLSYSYYPGTLFGSGTLSATYDFIGQQTGAGLSLVFNVSPSLAFGTNVSYNVSTQQITEVDYVVNARCDCLSVGLSYQTFPTAPSSNRWYITLGINTLPGIATSLHF